MSEQNNEQCSQVVGIDIVDCGNSNVKLEQLEVYCEDVIGEVLSINIGICIVDNQNILKVGECGLLLFEDFIMCEKIIYFDYECIFECVVYVCGLVVYGYFEVYEDFSDLIKVGFFVEVGKCILVFVCFFIVQGLCGFVDMVCDVCGFVVKFYIDEGNFDLVGNNMLVFFIQDVIKFFDFVYVVKFELYNEIFIGVFVYDIFWDFVLLILELVYMVMWLMFDCVILIVYCNMQGFGVYIFCLVNVVGESVLVKFYW